METENVEGRAARCRRKRRMAAREAFCGIEIDIAGMAAHVTAVHMNDTADV
jgi:hypothetical protein